MHVHEQGNTFSLINTDCGTFKSNFAQHCKMKNQHRHSMRMKLFKACVMKCILYCNIDAHQLTYTCTCSLRLTCQIKLNRDAFLKKVTDGLTTYALHVYFKARRKV